MHEKSGAHVTLRENWRNRIVGHADVDPATLTPNPRNYRRHPERQVSALMGALDEVGWVAPASNSARLICSTAGT